MQKNGKRLEFGPYELEVFVEKTREEYARMKEEAEAGSVAELFRTMLPTAEKESVLFLEGLGLDPQKISSVRLLSLPDENGEVLFLCNARLCGRLLRGGEIFPRQSVEEAGISMIFVGDEKDFSATASHVPSPQVEMRFVLPLIYKEKTESNKKE